MRCKLGLVTVLALAIAPIAAAAEKERPKADDRQQILGVWKYVEGQAGERKLKANPDRSITLEFGKGTLTRRRGEQESVVKYKLDPSKSPKHMDWISERDGETRVSQRIYSLEGDTFKMCLGREGRPKELAAKEGQLLLVFRRVKAAEKDGGAKISAQRMRELTLQLSPGAIVFTRRAVVEELKVSDEQQQAIRQIVRKTAPAYNEVVAKVRDAESQEARTELIRKATKIRADAKKKAHDEVLTDEQRKKWASLVGKPATAEERRAFQQQNSRRKRPAPKKVDAERKRPAVPKLSEVRRVKPGERPTPQEARMALWMQHTQPHPVPESGHPHRSHRNEVLADARPARQAPPGQDHPRGRSSRLASAAEGFR